jgi:hypothetical protein
VTILPVDGFTRANRAPVRPIAPDKDLSGWIARGARPGLPVLKPEPIAPTTREDRRGHIAIPTADLIHRGVVTRNRPIDSQAAENPSRERRLITPRTPTMSEDWSVRREKRDERTRSQTPATGNASSADNTGSSPRKIDRGTRPDPRILPADRVTDGNASERKAKRGNDAAHGERFTPSPVGNGQSPAGPSGNGQPGNSQRDDSSNERHKRSVDTPGPGRDNNSGGSNGDATRERQRRNDEENQRNRERPKYETSKPGQDSPRGGNAGGSSSGNSGNGSSNNATPRQERPPTPRSEPAREERRPQKEERPADGGQRKKP